MPHPTVNLTVDEVDDLIYFSRVGDLDSLKESIEAFSKSHGCSAYSILMAAVDTDDDGLGSGSCLLHYPAANGNTAIVAYLVSLIPDEGQSNPSSAHTQNGDLSGTGVVNHQNVSGNTPLHWAGMNGHIEAVQALIRAGANPEIVNAAGRDAVVESEWSSKEGAAECAVWMLKECGSLEKGVGEGAGEDEAETENSQPTQSEDEPATEEKTPSDESQQRQPNA